MSLGTVEIMGEPSGGSSNYMSMLYDKETNTYFAPASESVSPGVLALRQMGIAGQRTATAVLDSGFLLSHPWIGPRLIESVDFTGEGPEDLNGHGTMVALLTLVQVPLAGLLNVKILNSNGQGKERSLIKALNWCADWAKHHDQLFLSVNLSLGIYRDCDGNCRLCRAALELRKSGVLISAAAGNKGPDNIPCPQRIGLKGHFTVVAAADRKTGLAKSYSGPGTRIGPEPMDKMVPVGRGAIL
jgi:subtilisin family serine protease